MSKAASRTTWLAQTIRARCLESPAAADAELEADGGGLNVDFAKRVAALPEPNRSAFALFHCVAADTDALGELLGLREAKFAQALSDARMALSPPASFPSSSRLQIHRPWASDSAGVSKAVRSAKQKPGLEAELLAQVAFDQECHRQIRQIPFPGTLALPEIIPHSPQTLRALWRQPAVLSIGVAVLVVLGVLVYSMLHKLDDFSGKEVVTDLVDDVDAMSGTELEEVTQTEAGKLGDWFMIKGFEDFSVPPELAAAKAVGARVYQHLGHPVAQIALNEHNAILIVFHGRDMKVRLNEPSWTIFQQDEWAVAVRGDGDNCYVVAFLGDSDDMKPFLHTVGKQD